MFKWLSHIFKPFHIRPHGLKYGEICPDCGTTDCRSHGWYYLHEVQDGEVLKYE